MHERCVKKMLTNRIYALTQRRRKAKRSPPPPLRLVRVQGSALTTSNLSNRAANGCSAKAH